MFSFFSVRTTIVVQKICVMGVQQMGSRKSLYMRCCIVCLLAVVSFFSPVSRGACYEAKYPNTVKTAREFIWKTIISGGANAASVAVMDGGKIVYSEGFGPAERSSNTPVGTDTRFNIGSTSKMFAAAGVLLLADEGKLGIDDPVVKHIPEFTMKDPRYRDITVRMLFNHSSGLPGSTFSFGYRSEGDHQALLLETLRVASLKHAPGEMSIYCNDGFTLAEMVIERLSGKKFAQFVEERIFKPLGMNDSGESIGVAGGKIAEFYDKEGKKYPPEVVTVLGAGGLSSTPEDLCRFGDSFTPGGRNILSEASLIEIMKQQPTPFSSMMKGDAILDAFGWDYALLPAYRTNGYQVVGKSGGTMCYSTNLQVLPGERLAVAAIFSGRVSADEATYTIMDALMKDKGLPRPVSDPIKKSAEPQPVPEELLQKAGYYVNGEKAFRFSFDKEKHELHISPLPQGAKEGRNADPAEEKPLLSLVHTGGSFHDREKKNTYYFITGDSGTFLVVEKVPRYETDITLFQKIEPVENPGRMSADVDGKLWLIRNRSAFDQISEECVMRSALYRELPGYVQFFGVNRIETPDFAAIAATGFRDQGEFRLFRKNGDVRAKAMQFVYSGKEILAPLSPGKNAITIKAEGENEWAVLHDECTLSFEKPAGGRVVVFSGEVDPELLYDSITDSGNIDVPGGALLFFAADPGDLFEITVR